MERFKLKRLLAWLVIPALLLLPLGGAAAAGGRSGRGQGDAPRHASKVSADLREHVRKAGGGERVTAIVQPRGEWDDEQEGALVAHGARVKQRHENLDARVVELPASAVEALAARDDIEYVSADREMHALGHVSLTTGADAARAMDTSAMATNRISVGIAVLDSGVDFYHTSLAQADGSGTRVWGNSVFTTEGPTGKLDAYGHGTHVASAAAGGAVVAGGAYKGASFDAQIVSVQVLDSQGRGSVSKLLQAMDWVIANRITYNIRVVNLSLGMPAIDSYRNDPVCRAVRRMTDLGIVVVAAAGNDGKNADGQKVYGQIHSPGIEPSALTVGASNTFGTDSRADDAVTSYSSRGPTRGRWTDLAGLVHYDNIVKPDLVAPGNKVIWAAAAANGLLLNNPGLNAFVSADKKRNMMTMNGTSMAAPLVAGAASLLLRHNPRLTPNMVKAILMYTAQPLAGFNAFEQGAGQLNVEGAVRLAKLVRTDLPQYWNPSVAKVTMPLGTTLLKSGTAAPAPQTTIAGYTFGWSKGLVLDHTTCSGTDLITKYQKVYGTGVLLGDATIDGAGVLLGDLTMLSSGVLMADSILTSGGGALGQGIPFLGAGAMLGDGVLLGDGSMLGDGVLLGDGSLLGEGVLMTDGTLVNDFSAQAQSVVFSGDATASMVVVQDTTTTTTTTNSGKRK
ncbi:MAG TPA: S8 family serine peptidase [Pyrinomonadaceae bacterium]|jgi:subtilisin family serine protease